MEKKSLLCPCGSNQPYANCCGSGSGVLVPHMATGTFKDFSSQGLSFGRQITVEMGAYMPQLEPGLQPKGTPWCTFFAAGRTFDSCNYPNPVPIDSSPKSPDLRIGLCNSEYRPIVQVAIEGQEFPWEMWLNDVLPPRLAKPHQIAVSLDSSTKLVRMYVDGTLRKEESLSGNAIIFTAHDLDTGSGSAMAVLYFRIWRRILEAAELASVAFERHPAERFDQRLSAPRVPMIMNIGYHGQIALLAHLDPQRVNGSSAASSIARRFLQVDNSLVEGDDDNAICTSACRRMNEIVNELASLIDAEGTDEPAILAYFKSTPAAAFLLCPTYSSAWREVELQDFGQIDFVFETDCGRHLVVEIEPPTLQVFRNDDEMTARATHAIDQVENWVRGIQRLPHLALTRFGTTDSSAFDKLVVIGRSSELSHGPRKDRWNAWKGKGVEMLTWDHVIQRARTLARRFSNPFVEVVPWA